MHGTGSNVFGPGIGLADQLGITLSKQRVTPRLVHMANADPSRGDLVGAAFRGEISINAITPESWFERECAIGAELSKLGLPMFEQATVVKAAESGVGIYDRFTPFIPGEFARKQLLKACEKAGINLYTGNTEGADYDGDRMPIETGVFTLDYASIFRPTNAEQHPYMLPYGDKNTYGQWQWATEQGGNGFSTVEEAIYMAVLRPKVEIGFLPYVGGSIRCQNAYGSDYSLGIGFDADNGLYVNNWHRSRALWDLWALPRKFRALGA